MKIMRFVSSLNEVHYGIVIEKGQGKYSHLLRVFWDRFYRPSLKKQPARLAPEISWVNPQWTIGGSRFEIGDWNVQWTIPQLKFLADGGDIGRLNLAEFVEMRGM